MSKTLLINTVVGTSAVGLAVDGALLASQDLPSNKRQSETVLVAVETVLKEANMTLDQITSILAVRGPGSFTGIRVGLAAAQGLAFQTPITVHAVTSFLACRENPDHVVLVPGRRGHVYAESPDGTVEEYALDDVPVAQSITPDALVYDALKDRFGDKIKCQDDLMAGMAALSKSSQNLQDPVEPTYLRGADVSVPKKAVL